MKCVRRSLARVSGTEATLFTAVEPVSAVLFAVTVLMDTLNGTRAGGSLVLMGMLVVALRRRSTMLR